MHVLSNIFSLFCTQMKNSPSAEIIIKPNNWVLHGQFGLNIGWLCDTLIDFNNGPEL
jgi:hypothetical protein